MKTKPSSYLEILCWLVLLCLAGAARAEAQTTRAEEWEAKQAKKAGELAPYKPNAAEKWVTRVEDWGLLLPVPTGAYPFFGSAYSGGGFALGAGFRKFYTDNSYWDIHGAWSVSNYRMLDTTFQLPELASDYVRSSLNLHYVYAGKVPFFGVGNDTTPEQEASFLYNPFIAQYRLGVYPSAHLYGGATIGYENYHIDKGDRPNVPSIEEIYDPGSAPGLGTDPQFVVPGAFATLDWMPPVMYSRQGGLLEAEWKKYIARDNLGFDFQRLDVQVRQFIPILRANQVLALRALASITDIKDANQVPFFLFPKLGGGEELRGFGDFRFRDRNRMLLTAEYRWTPSRFMDFAIFYEAGKVAARREDLDFNDLHNCWGFGVRFHTFNVTPLRIEYAHSVEADRIIFSGGTSF